MHTIEHIIQFNFNNKISEMYNQINSKVVSKFRRNIITMWIIIDDFIEQI